MLQPEDAEDSHPLADLDGAGDREGGGGGPAKAERGRRPERAIDQHHRQTVAEPGADKGVMDEGGDAGFDQEEEDRRQGVGCAGPDDVAPVVDCATS